MNIEFAKIKQKHNIAEIMTNFRKFTQIQESLAKYDYEPINKTVVIDIENTLVTLYDFKTLKELENLKKSEKFDSDFILIDTKSFNKPSVGECCENMNTPNCVCHLRLYQLRPYIYEFLNAFQPFFELIAYSKMNRHVLQKIIDHIEEVLNRPIMEYIESQRQNPPQQNKFQRPRQKPQKKVYFQFIIHEKQYIYIKEHDVHLENLMILLNNRLKSNIIFISSHSFRIVSAINQGFATIPIVQYESFYRDDFQLNLIENYIFSVRNQTNVHIQINDDFQFLIQKVGQPQKYIKKKNSIREKMKSFKVVSSHRLRQEQEEEKKAESPKQIDYSSDNSHSSGEQNIKRYPFERVKYDAKEVILEEDNSHSQSYSIVES